MQFGNFPLTGYHTKLHLQSTCDDIKNLKNSSFQVLQGWVNFHLFIIKCQGHTEEGQAVVIAWIKQIDKLLYTCLKQGFQLGVYKRKMSVSLKISIT